MTSSLNNNSGTQGANISHSTVQGNININFGQSDHQTDIMEIYAKYKEWVREEKEHTIVRKKLKQLNINGKRCQIKRKLNGSEGKFPEDELLNRIPQRVTSLVTGPAGSGKSTLAASTLINWAESEESRYDLVLFFCSLHKVGDLPLHKQIWGEYAGLIPDQDSSKIYEELKKKTIKILVIIDGIGIKYHLFDYKNNSLYPDELQLSTQMESDANTAVADMSKNVSTEVLIYGILTNKILVGATVLGFSRSGHYMNKEFLDNDSKVYSIVDVVMDDVKMMIQEDPNQMTSILKQIKQVGLNHILLIMEIFEHQDNVLGEIKTATDLFLIILQGDLAFQSHKSDTTFSKLLNVKDQELMERIFQLCKENLQDEQKQAGVITGTVTDGEIWAPDETSEAKIPLSFLKRVGIFEIPATSFDNLTLTAKHLSYFEFFASVGIILSSDLKGEMTKIKNKARMKAVSVYMRNILLKFSCFILFEIVNNLK